MSNGPLAIRMAKAVCVSKRTVYRWFEKHAPEEVRAVLNTLKGINLLRPREVAAFLKVSRSTVYRWIYEGQLPAIRIFGAVRIDEQLLQKLIEEGKLQ